MTLLSLRWCARWALTAFLLVGAARPSSQVPALPGPIIVGPVGLVAAGDTLVYRSFSWGAAARATSYDVTYSVAATNGVWALAADSNTNGKFVPVLPLGLFPYAWNTCCTVQKAWFTAIPWDSATFTISVAARNNIGTSGTVATTWTVRRRPGLPGPIVVDSSLIVTGVLVQPPNLGLGLAQQRRVCAYPQFWGGAVATMTGAIGCDSLRLSLWAAVNGKQQAHADSMCFLWTSSNPAVATIAAAPCALGLRPALIWRVAVR